MLQITQSTNTPVSTGTGRLNSNWKRILFLSHKRTFESKLEGILSAAVGHEGNALPAGNHEYQVLSRTCRRALRGVCRSLGTRRRPSQGEDPRHGEAGGTFSTAAD